MINHENMNKLDPATYSDIERLVLTKNLLNNKCVYITLNLHIMKL